MQYVKNKQKNYGFFNSETDNGIIEECGNKICKCKLSNIS